MNFTRKDALFVLQMESHYRRRQALLDEDYISKVLSGPVAKQFRAHEYVNIDSKDLVYASSLRRHSGPQPEVLIKTVEAAKESLMQEWPLLERILAVAPEHLLVAGGSIHRVLRPCVNAPWYTGEKFAKDVDIFFVGGLNDCYDVLRRIMSVVENEGLTLILSSHAVSLVIPGTYCAYQFILKSFRNAAHVLHSFDLGPSRVAYSPVDGMMATPAGLWAVMTGAAVIEPIMLNAGPSLKRITKYTKRGFCFAFPQAPRPTEEKFTVALFNNTVILNCYSPPIVPLNFYSDVDLTTNAIDAEEYGENIAYVEKLPRFNLRKLRKGLLDTLTFTAPSFEQLMTNPVPHGLGDQTQFLRGRNNMNRPDFHRWKEWNPYTRWDIEERLDEDHKKLIKEACDAKSRSRVDQVVNSMIEVYGRKFTAAIEKRIWMNKHLFDVSFTTQPWSGWLCQSDEEFYGNKGECLPMDYAIVFWQLWKNDPQWKRLPRDLWRLIKTHFVLQHMNIMFGV